jgi:hypothetical protein
VVLKSHRKSLLITIGHEETLYTPRFQNVHLELVVSKSTTTTNIAKIYFDRKIFTGVELLLEAAPKLKVSQEQQRFMLQIFSLGGYFLNSG